MKKKLFQVFVFGVPVLLLSLFFCLLLVYPPPPPARSLGIQGVGRVFKNGASPQLSVVVSNASQYPIAYTGDAIWIAYLKDDTWTTNSIEQGRDEFVTQHPHTVIQFENYGDVPRGITEFKAGVSFTSLTWRSKPTLWKKGPNKFLDPFVEYLWNVDSSSRSKTEWSGTFVLSTN